MTLDCVCVYCGSRTGIDSDHATAATALGQTLARESIRLVYGGGSLGLMGLLANATLAAGGEVIGVIPAGLQEREVAHQGLTELRVVTDMHERKALMAGLASAFIALPGGLGTLEELFEMLTWRQLGLHDKPIGILNCNGYFDDLIGFLKDCVRHGYVTSADYQKLQVDTTAAGLLQQLLKT